MSPHSALRAYTVFPTAVHLRCTLMSHLLQYRYSLHISDVRVGRGLSCHRMAHFVLIRSFPQSSLSEAPRCRTFFSTGTVCTSPMCEWGGAIVSPHGALRAYTVFPTAEPFLCSPMSHILQYRYSLHISDVRVGRGYNVTAWRTSCLYGVTYSRASPRLPDVAHSSVPVQSAHL